MYFQGFSHLAHASISLICLFFNYRPFVPVRTHRIDLFVYAYLIANNNDSLAVGCCYDFVINFMRFFNKCPQSGLIISP